VSQQSPLRRGVLAACLFAFPVLLVSCASVVLVAHGMACPKCVTNADLQLMKLDGVRSVAIDMKHGFITVAIDPADRPSREDYARAIDAAGLTLVSVHEAPTEASAP
jgi:copper chaperone CopZ